MGLDLHLGDIVQAQVPWQAGGPASAYPSHAAPRAHPRIPAGSCASAGRRSPGAAARRPSRSAWRRTRAPTVGGAAGSASMSPRLMSIWSARHTDDVGGRLPRPRASMRRDAVSRPDGSTSTGSPRAGGRRRSARRSRGNPGSAGSRSAPESAADLGRAEWRVHRLQVFEQAGAPEPRRARAARHHVIAVARAHRDEDTAASKPSLREHIRQTRRGCPRRRPRRKSTRSILFTATASLRMPSSEAM